MSLVTVQLPLRLVSEANAHTHWRNRQRRAKAQRGAALLALRGPIRHAGLAPPCAVTLTRIAPQHLGGSMTVAGPIDLARAALGAASRSPDPQTPRRGPR